MKTYKIAIFGCGFVGGTVADLEQGGVEVTRVDPNYNQTQINRSNNEHRWNSCLCTYNSKKNGLVMINTLEKY